MADAIVPPRATAPLLKNLNERTVLEAIRTGAPISRAEISRRVGISKPTVSLALQSLLDAGLVREAVHDPDGPSYGALFFEPVAEAALVLGVDVGALGEQWRGVARGIDDFAFLSIGTGLGAGVVLRGNLHRGRHGAAGELDYVGAGLGLDLDPCAAAVSGLAAEMAAEAGASTTLAPPYDVPDVFAAARGGDAVARAVVEEEARRIALHIVPLAAVTDLAPVVLGGGLGVNGDLLLDPVRARLAEWVPYPPRVEVSGLGEAAVLTGALSVGVGRALDSVFINRSRAARAASG